MNMLQRAPYSLRFIGSVDAMNGCACPGELFGCEMHQEVVCRLQGNRCLSRIPGTPAKCSLRPEHRTNVASMFRAYERFHHESPHYTDRARLKIFHVDHAPALNLTIQCLLQAASTIMQRKFG